MTDQKLPVLLIVEDDEGLQRQLVVLGDVVRLAEPVHGVVGEVAVRVLLQERLEAARGFGVTAVAIVCTELDSGARDGGGMLFGASTTVASP